jgi:AcrR family transcriptional regulator
MSIDEGSKPKAFEPGPRRLYHKGNVAEDLKECALRILQTEAFEDLSIRRLTREVGVTPANFYNHFESLRELLLEVAAEACRQRAHKLAHIQRTSKTRVEAIKRCMLSYVDVALENYQLFRIMYGQIPDAYEHPAYHQASDAAFAKLVEVIYGEDIFRPNDLEWSRVNCRLAYVIYAMGYGLARVIFEGNLPFKGGKEVREFVERAADTFLGGEFAAFVAKAE